MNGVTGRAKVMASFMLVAMTLFMAVLILGAALLSSCATFVNRGDAFSDLKHRPVIQAQTESVYWPWIYKKKEMPK